MRSRAEHFIIGIGIMMAAAALFRCGKRLKNAVTTGAPTSDAGRDEDHRS